MKISILDTGVHSAKENMAMDEEMLNNLDPKGCPILHLYDWEKDSLTYGYFAKPEKLLDFSGIEKHHIDCARRITGGGVTLHFIDLAFSFFMPRENSHFSENTMENYAFVNRIVSKALGKLLKGKTLDAYDGDEPSKRDDSFFFCMAKPTRYDVMIQGKKVGGAAQRRTKRGYLHHGTLALARPDPQVLKDLLKDKEKVYQAMTQNSFYLIENHLKREELAGLRESIRLELIRSFQEA